MPALLEAEQLKKHYGSVRALDGVTFAVETGITGLLGAGFEPLFNSQLAHRQR